MSLGGWGAAAGSLQQSLMGVLDSRKDARAEARQRMLDERQAKLDAWAREQQLQQMKLADTAEARQQENYTYAQSQRPVAERLAALQVDNAGLSNTLQREEVEQGAPLRAARRSGEMSNLELGQRTNTQKGALLDALSGNTPLTKQQGRLAGALFGGNAAAYSDEAEKEAFGRQTALATLGATTADRLSRAREAEARERPYTPFELLEGTMGYDKLIQGSYNADVQNAIRAFNAEIGGLKGVVFNPATGGMTLGDEADDAAKLAYAAAQQRLDKAIAAAAAGRDTRSGGLFSSFAEDPRVLGSPVNRALIASLAAGAGAVGAGGAQRTPKPTLVPPVRVTIPD